MRRCGRWLAWVLCSGICAGAAGQQGKSYPARDYVWEAVRAELAADAADHSHWLYYEVDQKPTGATVQWAAEIGPGELDRILVLNGRPQTLTEQQSKMDSFVHDAAAQTHQRRSGQHDDRQATQMLNMLPNAFIWTITGQADGTTTLHFKPDPKFRPPTWESRVFAAMEGDMTIENAQHRIVSLKGRMIHKVEFGYGILGEIQPGGTFNVERRQIGPDLWQITETHVHIQGHALIFKSISDQEDDVKSKFERLAANTTFEQAEEKLMAEADEASNGNR